MPPAAARAREGQHSTPGREYRAQHTTTNQHSYAVGRSTKQQLAPELSVWMFDVQIWLQDILGDPAIQLDASMQTLQSGTILCRLAVAIEQHFRDIYQHAGKEWNSYRMRFNERATKGTFFARDNIVRFLQWCPRLIKENAAFQLDHLVGRNPNTTAVLSCLSQLAQSEQSLKTNLQQIEDQLASNSYHPDPVLIEHCLKEEENALLEISFTPTGEPGLYRTSQGSLVHVAVLNKRAIVAFVEDCPPSAIHRAPWVWRFLPDWIEIVSTEVATSKKILGVQLRSRQGSNTFMAARPLMARQRLSSQSSIGNKDSSSFRQRAERPAVPTRSSQLRERMRSASNGSVHFEKMAQPDEGISHRPARRSLTRATSPLATASWVASQKLSMPPPLHPKPGLRMKGQQQELALLNGRPAVAPRIKRKTQGGPCDNFPRKEGDSRDLVHANVSARGEGGTTVQVPAKSFQHRLRLEQQQRQLERMQAASEANSKKRNNDGKDAGHCAFSADGDNGVAANPSIGRSRESSGSAQMSVKGQEKLANEGATTHSHLGTMTKLTSAAREVQVRHEPTSPTADDSGVSRDGSNPSSPPPPPPPLFPRPSPTPAPPVPPSVATKPALMAPVIGPKPSAQQKRQSSPPAVEPAPAPCTHSSRQPSAPLPRPTRRRSSLDLMAKLKMALPKKLRRRGSSSSQLDDSSESIHLLSDKDGTPPQGERSWQSSPFVHLRGRRASTPNLKSAENVRQQHKTDDETETLEMQRLKRDLADESAKFLSLLQKHRAMMQEYENAQAAFDQERRQLEQQISDLQAKAGARECGAEAEGHRQVDPVTSTIRIPQRPLSCTSCSALQENVEVLEKQLQERSLDVLAAKANTGHRVAVLSGQLADMRREHERVCSELEAIKAKRSGQAFHGSQDKQQGEPPSFEKKKEEEEEEEEYGTVVGARLQSGDMVYFTVRLAQVPNATSKGLS